MDVHAVCSFTLPGSPEVRLLSVPEYLIVLVMFRAFRTTLSHCVPLTGIFTGGVDRSLRLTVIIYRYIPFVIIGIIGICVGNDEVFYSVELGESCDVRPHPQVPVWMQLDRDWAVKRSRR